MKRLFSILLLISLLMSVSSISVFAESEESLESEAWQEETLIPTVRKSITATAVGDNIYVIGRDKTTLEENTVQIYNTKTKTWSTGKERPTANWYTASSAVGSKIYVMGGRTDSQFYDTLEIYDTEMDEWTIGAPMLSKRCSFYAIAVDKKIYAIGGHYGGILNTLEIYDTETNTWISGPPMLFKSDSPSCAVVGNDIYVMGGQIDSKNMNMTDQVQIYNVETNSWRMGTAMPAAKGVAPAVTMGEKIYVTGGVTSGFHAVGTVEVFDTSENTWRSQSQLLNPRYLADAVLINERIYTIGGFSVYPSSKYINSIESFQVNLTKPSKELSVLLNIEEHVQLGTSYDIVDNTNLTWTSSNESVATVNSTGKVTAIAEGLTYIKAKNNEGFEESIAIRVMAGNVDEMRLAVHLKVSEKQKLYIVDDPTTVTWRSFDDEIAMVSDLGEVTALKKGLAIVEGELDGEIYQIYIRVNFEA